MFKPYCDRLHEYQALKASAKEKNYPNELIKSSKTKFMSIVNTINKNKIELLTLLGIPEHAVTKFRAAIFSQSVTASRFDSRTGICKNRRKQREGCLCRSTYYCGID